MTNQNDSKIRKEGPALKCLGDAGVALQRADMLFTVSILYDRETTNPMHGRLLKMTSEEVVKCQEHANNFHKRAHQEDLSYECRYYLDIEESLENLDAIRRMADTGYWLKTDVDDVGGIYKSLIKTLDRQLTDLYLDIHNAQAQAA